MLAWAIHFSRAAPGQPLPALESFDPDLPFMDAVGVELPPEGFDAATMLAVVDEEEVGATFGLR